MTAGRSAIVGALLLLAGCDASRDGRAAWREGRDRDALAAFDRAVEAAGDDASAELLYDQALAALRAGDGARAEAAAKRAAARGGADFVALQDFVRGNVAFLRSEAAEAEARRPGGEPTAHERAVAHAEDALAAWRAAATSRLDWPSARRNVERALLRLKALRDARSTGSERREIVPPPPRPGEPPPPDRRPEEAGPEAAPGVESSDLPATEVLRLLEVLRGKEREKQALRRAGRGAGSSDVERDW